MTLNARLSASLRAIGLFILGATLAGTAIAEDLPRRPFLGVRARITTAGLTVEEVSTMGLGAALGLRKGDVILELAGTRANTMAPLAAAVAAVPLGSRVSATIRRGNQITMLTATQAPRARETYAGATVSYGAVSTSRGMVRDILVAPNSVGKTPVIFLLQGYGCGSIESTGPNSLFGQLAAAFNRAHLAFYRVEKPAVGDSRGEDSCRELDFAGELASFRAAYIHLVHDLNYPADSVFLLGHSMGGIQAPYLAEPEPPRGIAVYGTVLKNWADYMQEIGTFQDFMMTGTDPVDEYRQAQKDREILSLFFFERQSPARIAADHPDYADRMKTIFEWDGGGNAVGGKSWKFLQDLASLELPAAWAQARTNVLSLYGATDEVALTSEDHRRIADIANYYRPGTARFQEVPGTMHYMDYVGNRDTFRERNISDGPQRPGPLNPRVAEVLIQWVRASMASTPVRLMTFPDALAVRVRRGNLSREQ